MNDDLAKHKNADEHVVLPTLGMLFKLKQRNA